MPKQTMKRNFRKEVENTLAGVFAAHPDEDLTVQDVWSLAQDDLDATWLEGIQEKAVLKAISSILRSSTFSGSHGEKVRRFQSYRQIVLADTGKEVQQMFWRDIYSMNRNQMLTALKARKAHADETVAQAEADGRFWNENVASRRGEKPIQLRFLK